MTNKSGKVDLGFEYIKVITWDDVTISYERTIPVPSGLSDDEVDDYIDDDRLEKWIYREENRFTEYNGDGKTKWFRSGVTENPLPPEKHLLIHTKKKKIK